MPDIFMSSSLPARLFHVQLTACPTFSCPAHCLPDFFMSGSLPAPTFSCPAHRQNTLFHPHDPSAPLSSKNHAWAHVSHNLVKNMPPGNAGQSGCCLLSPTERDASLTLSLETRQRARIKLILSQDATQQRCFRNTNGGEVRQWPPLAKLHFAMSFGVHQDFRALLRPCRLLVRAGLCLMTAINPPSVNHMVSCFSCFKDPSFGETCFIKKSSI